MSAGAGTVLAFTPRMPSENENGQQRTEQPTSKRLREAREKGQVCKSVEVSTALLFLASVVAFYLYVPTVGRNLHGVVAEYVGNTSMWDGSKESVVFIFRRACLELGLMTLPLLVAFLVVGLASNILQVGFVASPEAIVPKLSKLNPLKGFKNRFMSTRSLEQLLKTLVIMAVVVWVSYRALRREMAAYPPLLNADATVIVLTFFRSTMRFLLDVLWVFVVIAAADYGFQKWQFTRDLMMTRQEVRDEFKNTEGNPLIKSKIRSIQMHMARRRMMKAVPKADVVITNPTHLAVALVYDRTRMAAPTVVAKGAGEVALRIREVARGAGVPVVENKPLAQTLYKSLDIGDVIPEELYKAVAEILAYVYRLKRKAVM
ncbi:MAG TPA: flagellar biosynthesis protein FlhB [Deltaproteobacteria bacterium]|nr:flagellar biosynthesis protein FlhB [Deltaproteobacteria bacterium]HOM28141.1 flagellar biosynthesis protein FlhB [Deltaproteobacteria bacterium]HPP79281.1 flagellar biosynthesis protein FlhB [Deltaproteobacteria bacterium]